MNTFSTYRKALGRACDVFLFRIEMPVKSKKTIGIKTRPETFITFRSKRTRPNWVTFVGRFLDDFFILTFSLCSNMKFHIYIPPVFIIFLEFQADFHIDFSYHCLKKELHPLFFDDRTVSYKPKLQI